MDRRRFGHALVQGKLERLGYKPIRHEGPYRVYRLPLKAISFRSEKTIRSMAERAIAAASHAHDGPRLAEAHARLEAIAGYAARSRAAAMLHGLGFASSDLAESTPIRTASRRVSRMVPPLRRGIVSPAPRPVQM